MILFAINFVKFGAYQIQSSSISTEHTGASTVSLDLDKKWLDRIRPQMEANGITEWDGKHDCIYGDVSGQVSCG